MLFVKSPKINCKFTAKEALQNYQNFFITSTKFGIQPECSNSDSLLQNSTVPFTSPKLSRPLKAVPLLQPPPTFTRRLIGALSLNFQKLNSSVRCPILNAVFLTKSPATILNAVFLTKSPATFSFSFFRFGLKKVNLSYRIALKTEKKIFL
jgi:hypothetical protein